jgi:hypothetical protein
MPPGSPRGCNNHCGCSHNRQRVDLRCHDRRPSYRARFGFGVAGYPQFGGGRRWLVARGCPFDERVRGAGGPQGGDGHRSPRRRRDSRRTAGSRPPGNGLSPNTDSGRSGSHVGSGLILSWCRRRKPRKSVRQLWSRSRPHRNHGCCLSLRHRICIAIPGAASKSRSRSTITRATLLRRGHGRRVLLGSARTGHGSEPLLGRAAPPACTFLNLPKTCLKRRGPFLRHVLGCLQVKGTFAAEGE